MRDQPLKSPGRPHLHAGPVTQCYTRTVQIYAVNYRVPGPRQPRGRAKYKTAAVEMGCGGKNECTLIPRDLPQSGSGVISCLYLYIGLQSLNEPFSLRARKSEGGGLSRALFHSLALFLTYTHTHMVPVWPVLV